MKTAAESVKIGREEFKAIKELARLRGQFVSFLINTAIKEYLERQKKSFS